MSACVVRLIGSVPPDATVLTRVRLEPSTANDVIVLLAALTANRSSPSSLSTTAPCEPRPAPVPFPSVANDPAGVSDPSALRANARTAFPAAELLSVNTAPAFDPPRDSEAASGNVLFGAVVSCAQAASAVTRKAMRDSLSMTNPPRCVNCRHVPAGVQ